jgi:hypothetical protein
MKLPTYLPELSEFCFGAASFLRSLSGATQPWSIISAISNSGICVLRFA